MQNIFFTLVLILLSTACSSEKSTINLPFTTHFEDTNGWSLDAGAKFDKNTSATQGSGSIKLSKAGDSWVMCDRIISNFKLPVTAGEVYTLSFKSKTESWPPPSLEVYGAMLGEDGIIENSNGTMTANSQKGTWEENLVSIKIPDNEAIKYFKIKILMLPKVGRSKPIWIDDIRFEKGIKSPSQITQKKSFKGTVTRIDALGNIEINKKGKFIPFFPIGIYADNDRKDWTTYAKQGFNLNMWTDNAASIKKAQDAGLYSMMQIVQYMVPVSEEWIPQDPIKKLEHLHKTLQEIKLKGLTNKLLFYYVDNEFYDLKQNFTQVIDIVREEDKLAHPIYMLSGSYGMARKYNDYIDFTGTYVAKDGFTTPILENFTLLDLSPNQTQPTIIAQINRGIGKNFRPMLYGAIAKGAKGIGFWRDGGSAGNIETRPIWKQLPTIAKEIKQLMPLIRTSHYTNWQATTNNTKLLYGTRTLDENGYMIIANPTRKELKATFSLTNLDYQPKTIEDYFSHQLITKCIHATFTITIPPQDAKVIKITK